MVTVVLAVSFAAPLAFCAGEKNAQEDAFVPMSYLQKIQWRDSQSAESEVITIANHTSQVLRFDRPVVRVAVSDPDICDLIFVGADDILVNAKKIGKANLIAWDQDGNVATYGLQSSLDVERLDKIIHRIDEKAQVRIVPFNNTVAVYGSAETSLKLRQIQDAVKAFDEKSLNYMSIHEPKQVLLEVRFAEVNRTLADKFKFDLMSISRWGPLGISAGQTGGMAAGSSGGAFIPKGNVWDFGNMMTQNPTQSVTDIFWGYYNRRYYIQPYLQWLEQKGVLTIMARPNLIAKEGEESNFEVGGEYPVPVASSNGEIQIGFKKYGTNMKFTPEILDGGVIRLKLRAEVSQIDTSTTVTTGGVSVPGITQRIQSTVVELKEDQTLVIGGILNQKVDKVHRTTPFLSNLPVVGRLFTADSVSRTDIELLIVITPHIAQSVELNDNKTFYSDPKVIKESTRVFAPPFANERADSVDNVVMQNEPREDRGMVWNEKKSADVFAESLAKRMGDQAEEPERSWGWKSQKAKVITREGADVRRIPEKVVYDDKSNTVDPTAKTKVLQNPLVHN